MFLIFMELIVALDCSVLNKFGRLSPRIPFKNVLVFCENVLECVFEFPIDLLDLELLPHDFVLNVVDAVIQRGDVNLAVLNAGFRALQTTHQVADLKENTRVPPYIRSSEALVIVIMAVLYCNFACLVFRLRSAKFIL